MSMSYADTLNFDAGEEVHILNTRSSVKPTCESEEPFVIREAAWQLLDRKGVVVQEGDCEIRDHELDAFVKLDAVGTFYLRLSYKVADETWVDKFRLEVGDGMADAKVAILAVTIAPNPVNTNGQITITADIQPIRDVIGDDSGRIIDNDGAYIEAPEE